MWNKPGLRLEGLNKVRACSESKSTIGQRLLSKIAQSRLEPGPSRYYISTKLGFKSGSRAKDQGFTRFVVLVVLFRLSHFLIKTNLSENNPAKPRFESGTFSTPFERSTN